MGQEISDEITDTSDAGIMRKLTLVIVIISIIMGIVFCCAILTWCFLKKSKQKLEPKIAENGPKIKTIGNSSKGFLEVPDNMSVNSKHSKHSKTSKRS